jgi:hypothetical protein
MMHKTQKVINPSTCRMIWMETPNVVSPVLHEPSIVFRVYNQYVDRSLTYYPKMMCELVLYNAVEARWREILRGAREAHGKTVEITNQLWDLENPKSRLCILT